MKPTDLTLPEPRVPWVTPEPRRWSEILDEEAFDRGEELYILTIEDEDECIDLGEKGETADMYWAEGWTFSGMMSAVRSNAVWHEDELVRSLATRYRVRDIKLNRSLSRVLKKNADLLTVIRPLRITPGKEELNALHVYNRFKKVSGPLAKAWQYIVHYPSSVNELVVFSPDGSLLALSILETGGGKASYSTKTMWHPEHANRSLGTFCLLKAFEYARERGFEYHYVGPTILPDPNFNYKLRFPAAELYRIESNEWLRADTEEGMALFVEPFPRRLWDAEKEDWAE